ncbi:hypothetical protein CLD22_05900 [Rubrivivax gelatinosus]|nr:hypothetical protein [Rubrivivax gelatinosus]
MPHDYFGLTYIFDAPPLDERSVHGLLKQSGATDPDIIYALKTELQASAERALSSARNLSIISTVVIVWLVFSAIGIIFVPFFLLSYVAAGVLFWWGRKRRHIVARGVQRYCTEIGVRYPVN